MPRRARDRNVGQLAPTCHAPEHQPAPAHIATADEFGRKAKPAIEPSLDHIDILPRRDAPEQNHGIVRVKTGCERPDVPFEGHPKARLVGRDPDGRHRAKIRQTNNRLGRHEPQSRRDHEHVTQPGSVTSSVTPLGRTAGERFPVRELPPEIESAHELEDFPEGRPGVPQPQGERELGLRSYEELSALPAGVRWR